MSRSLRWVLLVVVVGIAALAVAGCNTQAGNPKALEAHAWKVTKLGSTTYSGQEDITAVFSAGKLSGSTGVNRYNGTYETPKGNEISIKLGATTLMAGTPEAMQAEQAYLKALAGAATYAVDESSLTLFDSSGNVLVVYAVDVPTKLTGTTWVMTSYNNGKQAVVSAESSAQVTAVFKDDGTLAGDGGVNKYSSKFTVSGDNIKIDPIVSTKMAGPEDLMTQESLYLAALQNATTFLIEGNELWMRDSSGAIQVIYHAK